MAKEPRKGWAECFKKVNEEQYKEIVSIVFNAMDVTCPENQSHFQSQRLIVYQAALLLPETLAGGWSFNEL